MKPRNEKQRFILKVSKSRPVAYLPVLSRVLGSVNAGLLLSQLLYWQGKGKDPDWIYKTVEDIRNELGLSKAQQKTALAKCKSKDFVEVKYTGRIPRTRHFKVKVLVIGEAVRKRVGG